MDRQHRNGPFNNSPLHLSLGEVLLATTLRVDGRVVELVALSIAVSSILLSQSSVIIVVRVADYNWYSVTVILRLVFFKIDCQFSCPTHWDNAQVGNSDASRHLISGE